MTQNETIGERLALLHPGVSRLSFAKKLGVSDSTLGNYERDERIPDAKFLAHLRRETGVDINWLVSGESISDVALPSDNVTAFRPAPVTKNGIESSDLVTIPAYGEVRPSAGAGSVSPNQQSTSVVAFDRGWLREIGVNPGYAVVLFADGDSMYPTIPNGSAMVVDTSKLEIRHGCIYVFDLDGDLMVKRIERLPDGTIDLISDNRDRYPTRNVTKDRLEKMHVVGRVYSAVRTF